MHRGAARKLRFDTVSEGYWWQEIELSLPNAKKELFGIKQILQNLLDFSHKALSGAIIFGRESQLQTHQCSVRGNSNAQQINCVDAGFACNNRFYWRADELFDRSGATFRDVNLKKGKKREEFRLARVQQRNMT